MSTPDHCDPQPRRRKRSAGSEGETLLSADDPLDSIVPSHLGAPSARLLDSSASDRRAAKAAFRARLEAGDYRELFGGRLGEVMAQAAEEAGVADELGALRIVLARLMEEEDDLVVLAGLVARVASVSIQAARLQRAISGQLAESLTDAVTTILADLEGGDR
jgi:hypothetical protein